MRSMRWSAAISVVLIAGCGTSNPGEDNQPTSITPPNVTGTVAPDAGSGSGGTASCPLGAAAYTARLGSVFTTQAHDLVLDAHGNAILTADAGTTALSTAGDVLFAIPFGSVAAADRAGNIYIAGSFTQPIDLGLGTMVPQGNIDVFVAKLDAAGHVVSAKALGQCGDGVESLAVDGAGRIAISGTAMGTLVLSATGDIQFQLTRSGHVAFDSAGNLVLVGSFNANENANELPSPGTDVSWGFYMEVDPTGKELTSRIVTGNQVYLTGVAINAQDRIAVIGKTLGYAALDLGVVVTVVHDPASGRQNGGFVTVFDRFFNPFFAKDAQLTEANGVALDAAGNVFISGATVGNTGLFQLEAVDKIDAVGNVQLLPFGGVDGDGYGVAVDSCGGVIAGMDQLQQPSPTSPVIGLVEKAEF